MNHLGVTNIKRTCAALVPAAALILAGCGSGNRLKADNKEFKVVATIGMIADTAAEIGAGRAEVTGLMGPGVDPHLYKASAGDVRRLQEAQLILFNGLHLEARMGEILEELSERRPVYAVGESLPKSDLISDESFGSTHDPHIWFDVSLWMKVSNAIAQALIETDPRGADLYKANLAQYQEKLADLDAEVRENLNAVGPERRVLVTAHDAFGYLGKAYGFQVKGLQGISTVSEAGARDVRQLADFIAEKQIPAIFVESSVPRRNIEALQAAVKDRGFNVEICGELFSDAMGEEGTEEGTYIGMVRHNVNVVASALKGN